MRIEKSGLLLQGLHQSMKAAVKYDSIGPKVVIMTLFYQI